MGDIFSATRGGFYGVWQQLQIGHRRAAPLPRSRSLRRLRLSLLKGKQRRERWDLNGRGGGGNMLFADQSVSSDTSGAEGAEGSQEVSSIERASTPLGGGR